MVHLPRPQTQLVGFVHVHAGIVDYQIGRMLVEHYWPRVTEQARIATVISPSGHINIQVGCALSKREVGAAVHAERENVRIGGEDGRGAVSYDRGEDAVSNVLRAWAMRSTRHNRSRTLVYIQIDDSHTTHMRVRPSPGSGDRQVV